MCTDFAALNAAFLKAIIVSILSTNLLSNLPACAYPYMHSHRAAREPTVFQTFLAAIFVSHRPALQKTFKPAISPTNKTTFKAALKATIAATVSSTNTLSEQPAIFSTNFKANFAPNLSYTLLQTDGFANCDTNDSV